VGLGRTLRQWRVPLAGVEAEPRKLLRPQGQ
jgi:hypothetical protein